MYDLLSYPSPAGDNRAEIDIAGSGMHDRANLPFLTPETQQALDSRWNIKPPYSDLHLSGPVGNNVL